VRRNVILLALCTIAGVALVAVQPSASQTKSDCTWVGTPSRDVKTGTRGRNILCAKGGSDFLHGQRGNDQVRGGQGRDTVVGGGGRDVVRGGKGSDRLFAVDDRGGEEVNGGRGRDQCFVDPGDRVSGCEETFRSNEPEMAAALGQSLAEVMQIAEALPSPAVTVTATITTTITLPPCGDGPPDPPPFCEQDS
jgi:RTX calcium-binding nonapeptide repeat (4 copies)